MQFYCILLFYCISLHHSWLSICPANRCSLSSRPLTLFSTQRADRGYLSCSPEVWCDWRSSDQVGSASVSSHSNILVLSVEHMEAPRLLETRGAPVWKPLIADSEHLFFTDHTLIRPADGTFSCADTPHTSGGNNVIGWGLPLSAQPKGRFLIYLVLNICKNTMQNLKC